MKFKKAHLTKSGKYDVTLRLTVEEIGTLADGIIENFDWHESEIGSESFWINTHDVLIDVQNGIDRGEEIIR